ncbi:transcriptional repressor LexA [Longimicrobium terrae]|uniref:LexA repressor n=1 Tax=Longimicrobium terrae TaxID=1639882 RepID=A0A841GL99_9BACT|nr:transcriptional repressor LexA [Longimicrobium terrae]MBB4635127.1 repressor LexA [Longimicrobium terrae]MBB6069521.1 repressor LexA [Longimicrobium terrae]NNC31677.1 transcriptional repressor LexA [Longimicrobium terrae]
MPEALTKIERRILNYLVDYLKENTYQPSIREIGKRFGIKSTKTVSEHLQSLADKNFIERDASRSRGVKILGMNLSPSVASVPLYGQIAAGVPVLLREDVVEEFEFDRKLVGSADAFLLQVKGDSMTGMGISENDMVLVEPVEESDLQNGDIVAARVDGDATVKRYFANGGKVVLEPANTAYAPILVHEHNDFTVLGRVSGLYRRFTRAHTEAIVTGAH